MKFKDFDPRRWLAAACICGWLAGPALAGDDRPPERADDVAAIRGRTADFVAALTRGDPEDVAAFWTEQGEYAGGDAGTIRGRDRLREAYSRLLAESRPLTASAEIESVRFLSRDTAVVEGTFEAQRAKETKPRVNGFSILWVREGGPWSIAVLREWARTPSLRDLDWLIGTWSSRAEDAEVRATYRWNEGKTFILMQYSIRGDGPRAAGLQVIGLDPATGAIRSWIFDDEGGIGTGTWERDGKRWIIRAAGIEPDGAATTATNALTMVDGDTFRWESGDRTREGGELPDIKPVVVSRIRGNEAHRP